MENKYWTVEVVEKDAEHGNLSCKNNLILFADHDAAKAEGKRLYNDLLHEYDLEDNNACDTQGNGCAGGCWSEDEGVIWDYMESEFGRLTERAIVMVRELQPAVKICAHCGENISEEDAYVMAFDKPYHEDCFLSAAANILLEKELANIKNR